MSISHILELFAFNRWANQRLYDVAATVDDAALDREFEIGFGTFRKTINHNYAVERIWYERHGGPGYDEARHWEEINTVDEMRAAHESLDGVRESWLQSLTDVDLSRPITYTTKRGDRYTNSLRDICIHVCDHGVHHRAQASNMVRHIGKSYADGDYLRFKLAHPTMRVPGAEAIEFLRSKGLIVGETLEVPRRLSVDCLRDALHYNDWANGIINETASALTDAQLDQPFEMGMGTLRKTLIHIEAAERFWLEIWRGEETPSWKPMDDKTSLDDLSAAYSKLHDERSSLLCDVDDNELQGEVSAEPIPGKPLFFRLGETILQICFHGTHHRAQALNMLRHAGKTDLRLDFITSIHKLSNE